MPNRRFVRQLVMRRRSTGPTLDAATTAWVNAVVGAGGTVSAGRQTVVDTLITSLKAHSLWTIQDRIWLHASENEQQATIDIVNLGVASITGSVTFTANQGYTGDGSTGFLNTSFANGTNFTQNSASISTYIRNSRTFGNNGVAIGAFDADAFGAQSIILPLGGGNNLTYDVNNSQFSSPFSNSDAQGFWTSVRTGASAQALYKNSSSTAVATNTNGSLSLADPASFYILARNQDGSANLFSSDQVAITTIGGGMTNGTNVAQFQSDLNAYMTAIGANVY